MKIQTYENIAIWILGLEQSGKKHNLFALGD